LLVSKV